MTKGTDILLIRHGETDWNAAKRLQGHIDIPLNQQGARQARALGQALRDEALDAVITSDLQRARQTALAVAQQQSLPVQSDPGLRERCYGAFEGMNYSEIGQRYPAAYAAWQNRDVDAQYPPGEREAETLRQFYERTLARILHWAQRHPGQKIALVAHGGVLECAYRAARVMPLAAARDFPILNASINRLHVRDGALQLVAWGEVGHLAAGALDEVDRRVP
jgi:probable phosphoglycerate mutase